LPAVTGILPVTFCMSWAGRPRRHAGRVRSWCHESRCLGGKATHIRFPAAEQEPALRTVRLNKCPPAGRYTPPFSFFTKSMNPLA